MTPSPTDLIARLRERIARHERGCRHCEGPVKCDETTCPDITLLRDAATALERAEYEMTVLGGIIRGLEDVFAGRVTPLADIDARRAAHADPETR